METKISATTITVVLSIICLLLISLGVNLIVRSHEIYQESLTLTRDALKGAKGASSAGQVPSYASIKDGYAQALIFFTLAIGCIVLMLLLPRIQTFSVGPSGVNVTLQALQQSVTALATQGNSQTASSAGVGGIPSNPEVAALTEKTGTYEMLRQLKADTDPQKGRWGGKAENNFRKLSAEVENSAVPGFFKAYIKVESLNDQIPLNGVVKFHLHPTFDNPNPVITVQEGFAMLALKKVLGPFTVGAEADDGATQLELDLSTLTNLPDGFKAEGAPLG